MSNEQEERSYSPVRSRSRSRDRASEEDYDRDGRNSRNFDAEDNNNHNRENFALYVTNLSTETTDDTLKATFERFGEVQSAHIVKEPITKKSRGFAFVTMAKVEDTIRAMHDLNDGEIDGHTIRVEKAKRKEGYEKTPGQYLGPPQLSSKYRRDREDRDRRGRTGDASSRERRDDHRRGDSRDRLRDPRDFYDRYPPYPLPPPHLYDRAPLFRDDRYFDLRAELYRRDLRYDPRDIRAPPLLAPPLYDLRRSPPRLDYRGRSPLAGERRHSDREARRRSTSRH